MFDHVAFRILIAAYMKSIFCSLAATTKRLAECSVGFLNYILSCSLCPSRAANVRDQLGVLLELIIIFTKGTSMYGVELKRTERR